MSITSPPSCQRLNISKPKLFSAAAGDGCTDVSGCGDFRRRYTESRVLRGVPRRPFISRLAAKERVLGN